MSEKKSVIQQGNIAPIANPQVKKAIEMLRQASTKESQQALSESLKTARLLSPCGFDVEIKPTKDGKIPTVNPTQIKYYLVNTNDGKQFFPAFTDINESTKFKMTGEKDEVAKNVVRTIYDYDKLLNEPGSQAQGVMINPGSDNIVIPKQLIAVLSGRITPEPQREKPQAPVQINYVEPSVYPTKMVNEVYDLVEQMKEIQKVWLKGKLSNQTYAFALFIESQEQDPVLLQQIQQHALTLSKGVDVEVTYVNEEIKEKIIKDATPLFDRELSFE